jgi:flagellin-like hook-associated protein FlgL
MAINSIGSSTSLLGQSIANIKNQLNTLQVQLATGEKSTTYSGMGTGEGFAIAARAQLANITGYQNTITNVGTTISAANTALQALVTSGGDVATAANSGSQTLNSTGQTTGQTTAVSELSSMLSVLNTQAGNGYIFSGSATNTPSVATADEILNGNGAQAGLTQVISERQQADLGPNDNGRLTVTSPTTTSVSVAQDSSPFGIKLSAVTSTLTGATVTGPTGTPAAISVSLGATNPNPGDQLNITLTLPDGTTQSIQLTATTTSPPPAGSFLIGTTPAATAANLQTALQTSINTVANTSLVAASAMEASSNFFDQPPQRVSVTPPGTFATATSLVAGTSANTVSWYTGGTTTGSARATQVAQIGPEQTVSYGIQANEQGIASQLQAIAAFAAFTVSPSSTNAAAQVSAMSASVAQALSTQPNQQSIQDIQTDLANAQTTMSTASSLQTQTQSSLQDIVSQIETVSPDQVASQILALQTSLQASYQTTSMLSQLSLVKFLPIPSA